jgi:hypothetical protein
VLQTAIENADLVGKVKVAISVSASTFFKRPLVKAGEGGEDKEGDEDDKDAAAAGDEDPFLNRYNLTFKNTEETGGKAGFQHKLLDDLELTQMYRDMMDRFPEMIVSFEDPFDADDWASHTNFTEEIGDDIQVHRSSSSGVVQRSIRISREFRCDVQVQCSGRGRRSRIALSSQHGSSRFSTTTFYWSSSQLVVGVMHTT